MNKDFEGEITRNMLKVIREEKSNNGKQLLREFKDGEYRYDLNVNQNNQNVEAGQEVQEESGEDVRPTDKDKDLQSFKEDIDGLVVFNLYKVYPESRNVILTGNFSGVKFQFNLQPDADGNGGLYVDTNNLSLGAETLEKLQKLEGYYKNWVKIWSNRLNEYKTNQTESIKRNFKRLLNY